MKKLFGLLFFLFTAPSIACSKPANIILILADDVSADMFSCYGQADSAHTPNIDQIAANGVCFRTCFAPAICAPSRACLMTGMYGNRTGVFRNDMWAFDSRGTLFTAQPSWAKLIRDAGYATAIAGKWHCGAKEAWEGVVGFDEYCLWESPKKIESHFGTNPITTGKRDDLILPDTRYWYPAMVQNGHYVPVDKKDFGPDKRLEFLLNFVEQKTREKKPFVAYWPTVIPHGPYSTTPDHGDVLDIEQEKPHTAGMQREEKLEVMNQYEQEHQQRFIHLIEYLDKLIGKLVARTKQLGIYDNTYFIFCADNGTAVTAKDRGVERGVHVPFVVQGPRIKKRGLTDELTDFSDIAPTLLDMTGTTPPTNTPFDGKSLLPFLTAKTDTHREWIYAYTGPVQVVRTKTHLLEAVSPFYGKPDGRFYSTSDSRFGRNYKRVDGEASHARDRQRLEAIIASLPSHLAEDHPFWTSKLGTRWLHSNDIEEVAKKQLYNHSDYSFYDETD